MKDKENMVAVEDIIGGFGFRISRETSSHFVTLKAYKITGKEEDGTPLFNRDGWESLPDPVKNIKEAEEYLEGFVPLVRP